MEERISQLVAYAQQKGWIEPADAVWAANRILEALGLDGFGGLVEVDEELPPIQEILDALCEDAARRGMIDGESITQRDLLDTKLMGLIVPRPGEVISAFLEKYLQDPQEATGWYYAFSGDTNYIRRARIARDQKWTVDTEYGTLDITINLSKPEKDPKAIAAAGKAASTGYPKCLLCVENEGYAGRMNHPARQNHRLIPIQLAGEAYSLQYSPYVYYNEHCIVLNQKHTPMAINLDTFRHLLEFVTLFPHYFLGSNADLPIVGGSVLSHDHYQGGHYTFAMERAQVETEFTVKEFPDVTCGIVKWPMTVLRLRGADKERLAQLAQRILEKWKGYDDPEVGIYHETEGERHNTITPIARRRGQDYELDLVLRNNRTSEEYPLGIFHPHQEKHHIKKENIGLIEVMGLAVLPSRLKGELAAVADALATGKDLSADPRTASHREWAEKLMAEHPGVTAEQLPALLQHEVGKVFCAVLEDAGVYKRDAQGKAALRRFVESI